MKHLFLRTQSALLLGGILVLSACKKDDGKNDDPTPAPTTGFVAGKIEPAGSITAVVVTDRNVLGLTYRVTPSPTGSFILRDISPGTCSVQFEAIAGYDAPATREVAVTAGDTAYLGTIQATVTAPPPPPPPTPAGDFRVNGNPVAGESLSGSLIAGILTIRVAGSGHYVRIQLDGVTGPGTYRFATYTTAAFYEKSSSNIVWSTRNGGDGNTVITDYDAVNRRVSGTFRFIAGPGSTNFNTPSVDITTGSFNNVSF